MGMCPPVGEWTDASAVKTKGNGESSRLRKTKEGTGWGAGSDTGSGQKGRPGIMRQSVCGDWGSDDTCWDVELVRLVRGQSRM